jgi:acyl transferase domain-containing protein
MPQVSIAVVGVSALFPGSTDAHGFWRDILAGRDLVTDVPPTHWLAEDYYDPNPKAPDKTYSKRGAFLPVVPFDPMEFGIPPSVVPATDTSQLLALIVAQKVLDDATQGQFATMNREKASVILGCTSGQELLGTMVSRLQRPIWLKGLRDSGVPEDEAQKICDSISKEYPTWQESTFPGLLGNIVAGRIANRFDLRGTNCVSDAACASSLSALSMGVNELVTGQSDLVIAGGVDTMNDIFMYMCFSKTPALSPTGDCRPFSDAADGTLLGEGIAMLALKRLEDAERDGDRVYAVLRGVGSASDGRSKSVYAPLPEGQARAIERTYEVAGYGADTVELVEAHGTATKAGDVAEFEGLKLSFGKAQRSDRPWCALGSVKSQIGHTKSAAGAAGLFKAVMALHHKVLPPTIKVDKPNPKLGIEGSPFYLNTKARPWIRDAAHPRRAGVSSFGFGGSNFHVTLEEYTGPAKKAWRARTAPTELVLLSGATGADVAAKCAELAKGAADGGSSRSRGARSSRSTRSSRPASRSSRATRTTSRRSSSSRAASSRRRRRRPSRRRRACTTSRAATPGRSRSCSPGRAASTSPWAPSSR